jgi:hypothetical protein
MQMLKTALWNGNGGWSQMYVSGNFCFLTGDALLCEQPDLFSHFRPTKFS